MFRNTIRSISLLVLLLAVSENSLADVPESQAPEVDYLIRSLKTSGCEMIRNGKSYDGEAAAAHVRLKYDYFRDEIFSTQEFIERAATRSTMSGKAYMVDCPGEEPIPSADWLQNKLKAYRKKQDRL